MGDPIRVNGNAHSWGSIYFKVDGDRFYGFTAIGYADSRERAKGYGMGKHHAPRLRSRGKYATEPVKVTGWKGSVQKLREKLASLSETGTDYGDVEVEIVIQYIERGDVPIDVEIERCVWSKNEASDEENPDPLKESFEMDCMKIRRNGLVLFDSSEGEP